MVVSGRSGLGALRSLQRAILGLYILAAALMPLGHHDIACHLKSNTHCSTCVVGSSGESPSHAVPVCGAGLSDAGAAQVADSAHIHDQQIGCTSGRAPPSA